MIKRTSDIYFASALASMGCKLEFVDRSDPRHMVFEFSEIKINFTSRVLQDAIPPQGIEQLPLDVWETEWANKNLMVNAWEFSEALKRMKSIVHSGD